MKMLFRGFFIILPVLFLVTGLGFAGRANAEDYYAEFGGQTGMTVVVDHFVNRVLKDQRIASYFAQANIPALKKQLAVQFCMLLSGPCTYCPYPSNATSHK